MAIAYVRDTFIAEMNKDIAKSKFILALHLDKLVHLISNEVYFVYIF